MRDLSEQHFGILIAYVLPGFVTLSGLSFVSPTVAKWMAIPPHDPSLSGISFVSLGSLGAGLTLGAFRWAVIDKLHESTGVPLATWSLEQLHEKLAGFYAIVLAHYRYYQLYGGMAIAVPLWMMCYLIGQSVGGEMVLWLAGGAAIEFVLILASRDSLRKYHTRASQLLAPLDRSVLYLPRD